MQSSINFKEKLDSRLEKLMKKQAMKGSLTGNTVLPFVTTPCNETMKNLLQHPSEITNQEIINPKNTKAEILSAEESEGNAVTKGLTTAWTAKIPIQKPDTNNPPIKNPKKYKIRKANHNAISTDPINN